jgi:hypothetical protein
MCRGDVSIITTYWQDDQPLPVTDFSVPHACVNWDLIYGWAKDHSFDPLTPGYIQHPKLGNQPIPPAVPFSGLVDGS